MTPRPIAALIALLVLAGCGDGDLWARYRAERDLWRARRLMERLHDHSPTSPAYQEAIEALAEVEKRFPLAVWATPERLRSPKARDVATLSGDALIAIGRVEESRQRFARAIEVYQRAASQLGAMPRMRLKALLAEAALFDRTDDSTRAHGIYLEIARTVPPVDATLGEPIDAALAAPLRVAADLRSRGAAQTADSVLIAAEAGFVAEATRRHGRSAAPTLWWSVGRLRAARPGALDAALNAVRKALDEGPPRAMRVRLIMDLAQLSLDGGRPDSALVYAAWASQGFGAEVKARAMTLTAQIWERVDLDSAVAAYGRYVDTFHNSDQPVMAARFRRAELLEQQGRWLQARAEFRGLATSSATDEFSLRSLERIVTHHLAAGEKEMGRIEANRALEAFDHLLTTVQDDETLLRIRQARARVLLDIESWDRAYAALEDLWKHYGHLALGVQAGFRAAELAERQLRDRERARRLYEQLATGSPNPIDQAMARRQLERMRHERG